MWYRSLCLYLLYIIRWNLFVLRNDINTTIIRWNRSLFRRLLSALCPCSPFPTKLQIAALLCIISRSETPFPVKYRILVLCFYVKYRVLRFFLSFSCRFRNELLFLQKFSYRSPLKGGAEGRESIYWKALLDALCLTHGNLANSHNSQTSKQQWTPIVCISDTVFREPV